MSNTLYCLQSEDTFRTYFAAPLTAIYHERSGITHVVADPVPQILDIVEETPKTAAQLLEVLSEKHELAGDEDMLAVLKARLDELIEVGLVSPA